LIHDLYIEKEQKIQYCGFKKFHPHDSYSIVRVSYIDNVSIDTIQLDLQQIFTHCISIFKKIYKQIK